VVVAARELRVIADVDEDVQIAGRSAVEARLPFAGDAQARPVVDAGRDLHRDLLLFANASRAIARRARILDHFSRAAALRAGAGDGEESLRVPNLSAALAARTRHRLRSLTRARAVAGLARDHTRHGERDVFPEHGLHELELEVVAEVVAARGARASASSAAIAEEIAEAEEVAEDVAEVGELIRIEPAEAAGS